MGFRGLEGFELHRHASGGRIRDASRFGPRRFYPAGGPSTRVDGLRTHGNAGNHAKVRPRVRGTGDRPRIARLRREPGLPARLGPEDGQVGTLRGLRPREVRRIRPRRRMLRDHDRGTVPGRCERGRNRGRVQRTRVRTPPAVRDGGPEADVPRTGRPRRVDRGVRPH